MDYTQLQQLWVQAGGDPNHAETAAAVAIAESGGNPDARNVNTNGTVDVGLWQINSIHGAQATFDPIGNARAAVAISDNGKNWRPWCTAWSDGACGTQGGTYGANSPVAKVLADVGGQAVASATSNSFTKLGSVGSAVKGELGQVTGAGGGELFGGIENKTIRAVLQYGVYGLEAVAGFALIGVGVVVVAFAFYRRNPELAAAIPGVGQAAGASAAARQRVEARGAANRAQGGRVVNRPSSPPRPRAESIPGPNADRSTNEIVAANRRRNANREASARMTGHRPRTGRPGPTREQAGAPF